MMSRREDILDGSKAERSAYGLVYTEVLGWIDLGHAQGNDIRQLWAQNAVRRSTERPDV